MTADGQLMIAICTPVMRRVHGMWEYSRELLFVDSSGNMDRQNCRVFLFLTHSPAGALPLGVVITSSESESTLTAAFDLLKSILPSDSFFKRKEGPEVILTDDCAALRMALHGAFPEAVLLLCAFHMLQAMWRWLWDVKHGIAKIDRPHLLYLVKGMLYAKSTDELEACFQQACHDTTALKYKGYIGHVEALYERREEWTLAARKDLNVRGHHTTAYCEAGMRVLKDKIFNRLKAFNVCQLTDFMLSRYEDYNIRKLIDISNNRLPGHSLKSKYYPSVKDVPLDTITRVGGNDFSVPSSRKDDVYHVNMDLGTCTCSAGETGAPCKHQAAVIACYGLASNNFLPVNSPDLRKVFQTIATGAINVDDQWFQPLQSGIFEQATCSGETTHVEPPSEESVNNPGTSNAGPSGTYVDTEGNCNVQESQHANKPASVVDALQAQADLLNRFGKKKPVVQKPQDTDEQLKVLFNSILKTVSENPEEFESAVKQFSKNLDGITTDSHLISALHTFGKYTGAALKQRGLGSRKLIQISTKIGVQPTSVARRKMAMGGGKRLTAGRPSKATYVAEHGYGKRRPQTTSAHQPPPKKRAVAPHSLTHCVSENIALGKTHSAK